MNEKDSGVMQADQDREVFVPVDGQCFTSEQHWINTATSRLTRHPEYLDTQHSDVKGWRGHHFTAMCFDQKGRRCRNGADFMRATKEGAYPIWWVWPDQIADLIAANAKAGLKSVEDATPAEHDTNKLQEAKEIIGPFAAHADQFNIHVHEDDWTVHERNKHRITIGDLRRAREFLKENGNG